MIFEKNGCRSYVVVTVLTLFVFLGCFDMPCMLISFQ